MYFLRAFRPIAFDLIATIFFVSVYWGAQKAGWSVTSAIVLATALGVIAGVARFAWMKFRSQPIGPLQYLAIVLVVVAGVTTLLTQDPRFVQIKSSIVTAAVGLVMLRTNWMEPYLPAVARENLPHAAMVWSAKGWGILQLAMAALNAIVAFAFSFNVWTWYSSVVPSVAMVAAFAAQYGVFRTLIRRSIREKLAAGEQVMIDGVPLSPAA